jgi:hypothetical protein
MRGLARICARGSPIVRLLGAASRKEAQAAHRGDSTPA